MTQPATRIEVKNPRAFGSEPPAPGEIRGTGTVQGIIMTGATVSGAEYSGHVPWMWISLLVSSPGAAPFVADLNLLSYEMDMPVLGETLAVGWQPDVPDSFGIYAHINAANPPIYKLNIQPGDPATPLGWSGGVYDLPATEHDEKKWRDQFADDREVFRAAQSQGKLAQATVEWVRGSKHGPFSNVSNTFRMFDYGLKVWDRSYEIHRLTAPGRAEGFAGDTVWVAASPNGKDLVLDTDERFQGPARAVVWIRSAEALHNAKLQARLAAHDQR